MSGFQLGQRVAYSQHIRRRETGPGEFGFDAPNRIWSTNGGPFSGAGWEEHRWPGGEGVIVGKRTLSNGRAHWQEEGYTEYTIKETFTAYLIAYSLQRKPVHVLPEHITALDEEPDHCPHDCDSCHGADCPCDRLGCEGSQTGVLL